jgi:prolyl-tRNA editing enzyme YbaK/EbsC (Cys-tRNA(Pro) deacylase)
VPEVRIARPDEILGKTGYPCGGTPSYGYEARFLIDERVLQKEVVYTGGGSVNSLVKIKSSELVKVNRGQAVRIRKWTLRQAQGERLFPNVLSEAEGQAQSEL